jgi:hypothetical protein
LRWRFINFLLFHFRITFSRIHNIYLIYSFVLSKILFIFCIRDKSQLELITATAIVRNPKGKHSYQYIRVTASQEEIDGSTDR